MSDENYDDVIDQVIREDAAETKKAPASQAELLGQIELMQKQLDELRREKEESETIGKTIGTFVPGAPSAAPREPSNDPMSWTKADIERLRASGEFLTKLTAWRNSLSGAGMFRKRIPRP